MNRATARPVPVPRHRSSVDALLAHGGDLVGRGAVAGVTAGLVFLLANMGFATTQGKPAVAPMIDISTIFHGTDAPKMPPTAADVVTGLVLHLNLSALFGISFALLVALAPQLFRYATALAAGGIAYGLLVYVVNFQIFGNTLFEWFTNPKGPNQGFEVGIHAAYGLMLAAFFVGVARRLQRPAA